MQKNETGLVSSLPNATCACILQSFQGLSDRARVWRRFWAVTALRVNTVPNLWTVHIIDWILHHAAFRRWRTILINGYSSSFSALHVITRKFRNGPGVLALKKVPEKSSDILYIAKQPPRSFWSSVHRDVPAASPSTLSTSWLLWLHEYIAKIDDLIWTKRNLFMWTFLRMVSFLLC